MLRNTVTLSDRSFVIGDLARRVQTTNGSDVGVVVNLFTEALLEGVFSHRSLGDWIPVSKLVNAVRISRGDHVIAGDWVGVVEEVFEEAMVAS